MLKTTDILGVKITTSRREEILEYILKDLEKPKSKREKTIVFTPNPEQISAAVRNPSLKGLLNQGTINLPDGVGLVAAGRLLGKPIEARIAGVDFMQSLVRGIQDSPLVNAERAVIVGCFGGYSGVADEAGKCLKKIAPKITLGYASEVFDKQKMIQSDIDILFVGLGFPKQEEWIIEHKDEIPASVIMAVGGSFDFLSGRIPRAPKSVRNLGFEWLFRLILQPQRFQRQLQIWHFGGLIFAKALTNHFNKHKN